MSVAVATPDKFCDMFNAIPPEGRILREDGCAVDARTGEALRTDGNVLEFEERYEGYLTGDYKCSCFADEIDPKDQDDDSRQHIALGQLERDKEYKVTLHVRAEEIPGGIKNEIAVIPLTADEFIKMYDSIPPCRRQVRSRLVNAGINTVTDRGDGKTYVTILDKRHGAD